MEKKIILGGEIQKGLVQQTKNYDRKHSCKVKCEGLVTVFVISVDVFR